MSGDGSASPEDFAPFSAKGCALSFLKQEAEPRKKWEKTLGKAEPFRSSDGTAARKLNFQRCVDTNEWFVVFIQSFWDNPLCCARWTKAA
jgi:hypothetical protein